MPPSAGLTCKSRCSWWWQLCSNKNHRVACLLSLSFREKPDREGDRMQGPQCLLWELGWARGPILAGPVSSHQQDASGGWLKGHRIARCLRSGFQRTTWNESPLGEWPAAYPFLLGQCISDNERAPFYLASLIKCQSPGGSESSLISFPRHHTGTQG